MNARVGERMFCFLAVLLHNALLIVPTESRGQSSLVASTPSVVQVSTFWSASGVKSGGHITLAVVLEIRKPYHIGSDTATKPFIPTSIQFAEGPEFLVSSTAIFPEPKEITFGIDAAKKKIKVFSDRIAAYLPFAVGDSAPPGKKQIKIRITYQACDDHECLLPSEAVHVAELNVVEASTSAENIHPELFAQLKELQDRLQITFFGFDFRIAPSKLWLLLLIAGVGGFLLNLTPCVLPLVPIKIMGLARAAGNRRRCLLLGLAMAIGVVAFWMVLAIAIASLSGFNATNKLFQYPAFTVTVGLIIIVMAVGMSGVFTVRLPQWVYRANPSQGAPVGSFLFGIMTAVLSTPCTAPFMGAAAAWSATQAPAITITTFAAIGIGMALPYLLLSAFPSLVKSVPRTGPGSELIKQVMGILMLAAGSYFLGTGTTGMLTTPPDPPSQVYWWVVAVFIAAAGVWLRWRIGQIASRKLLRGVFGVLGLILILIAFEVGTRFTRKSPIHWVYFTPERLATARSQAKVVVLEFTAAWCLNCQALEQAVLHNPRVVALLNSESVSPIKVDITGKNPAGTRKLVETGRRAIPYLVIYSPDGSEVFASDAYTVKQITDAIEKASPGR